MRKAVSGQRSAARTNSRRPKNAVCATVAATPQAAQKNRRPEGAVCATVAAILLCAGMARAQLTPHGVDQVAVSIFNPTLNAIVVANGAGASGTHTPTDADQVFTSIFNAATNSIAVDCISGCSSGAAASLLFGSTTDPLSSTAPTSGQVLEWNGTNIVGATVTGTGTVTSAALAMPSLFAVSGSPITTSGTFSVTLGTENANTVFAGPSSGVAAIPAFRALVAADMPAAVAQFTGTITAGDCAKWSSSGTLTDQGYACFAAAGDLSGTSTSQTVVGLQGHALSSTAPTTNQALEWSGTAWTPTTLSSVGLPSSWSVNGTTNAVLGIPAASQDATTLNLTPSLATGGSYNIFQVGSNGTAAATSCSSGVYLAVTYNGNLCFSANNLQLGANNQATASYLDLWGGTAVGPYVFFASPALSSPPTPTVGNATTGGSLPAATYTIYEYFEDGSTNQFSTPVSGSAATATTGTTSVVTVSIPSGGAATQVVVTGTQSTNGSLVQCGVYTYATTTWTGSPTSPNQCTATVTGSTLTITAWANATTTTNPSTNSTGGIFHSYLSTAALISGDVCESATVPGADCAAGTFLAKNPTTAAGDLTYASGTDAEGAGTLARLGIGTSGQCLTVSSGLPAWGACGGGSGLFTSFQIDANTAITASGTYFQGTVSSPVTQTYSGSGTSASPYIWTLGCTTCVINNPSASQTIAAGSASITPLIINSHSGATADILDVDNNGTTVFWVGPGGVANIGSGDGLKFNGASTHFQSSTSPNDTEGTIAISAATSASHTFAAAWGSAPVCVLTPVSNPGTLEWWVTASTTAVTANISASGTITFNYICMGNPN